MHIEYDKNTVDFYNEQAHSYDDDLARGHLAVKIREHLQKKLAKNFKKEEHILEIGCGTGTDAIFIAEKGIFVTAIDPSKKMLEIAKRKVTDSGTGTHIELINVRGEDIIKLQNQVFTGAYSNFNALNHLEDLKKFSMDLASILQPKSKVYIVMLNKMCFIESFMHLLLLKPILAYKKLTDRQATLSVKLKLFFPRRVKEIFSAHFDTVSITGFGIFIPPDNFSRLYRRLKVFFNIAGLFEVIISSVYPFYSFCDHYLIEMEKR
jgi:ubiquinone/menaquinone biosynthesis C-methylase UbiE